MKFVAITSCSTGIAHTYMAAEALEMAAKDMGFEIKVETQGSIGAKNVLTEEDVAEADAVIIAASTGVNKDRFVGKRLVDVGVDEAIKDAKGLIERAKATKFVYTDDNVQAADTKVDKKGKIGAYKHLMAGVSYMIPFVVAGGILIALAFAFGGIHSEGKLASALMQIGGGTAFALMLPVLSAYIAFSIADRPGIVPGMVGGMLISSVGAGFLGSLISGFLAGYVILGLKKLIKLPAKLEGLMPVLVLPLLSCIIVGLTVIFVIGGPFSALNEAMSNWLNSLSGANSILLGLILGAMMAVDMAGPIGKAAYFFGVASLTTLEAGQTSIVMAAVMASGMVPPLGMALATIISKDQFSRDEKEAGKTAWVLGASFITEGAIPFAAADPLRVLPSVVVGASITGALSMAFKCGLAVPHGGIFVLPIPGAVTNLLGYVIAIAAGTVVSAVCVSFLKRRSKALVTERQV